MRRLLDRLKSALARWREERRFRDEVRRLKRLTAEVARRDREKANGR